MGFLFCCVGCYCSALFYGDVYALIEVEGLLHLVHEQLHVFAAVPHLARLHVLPHEDAALGVGHLVAGMDADAAELRHADEPIYLFDMDSCELN